LERENRRLLDAMSALLAAYRTAPYAPVASTTVRGVVFDAIEVVNTRCQMPELAGSYLGDVKRADRGF
jgi:hypothetical protein